MGYHHSGRFSDWLGAFILLFGIAAQYLIGTRLRLPKYLNIGLALVTGVPYLLLTQILLSSDFPGSEAPLHGFLSDLMSLFFFTCMATGILLLARDSVPPFNSERRKFLRLSSGAACALPAAIVSFGIITRKDFVVNEIELRHPNIGRDLNGLRLLQLSDIHIGRYFGREDVARVVDAGNGLRPDLALITGDLITDQYDPLDECLLELRRLNTTAGIWGCLGNHELYSRIQNLTARKASALDIFFLRRQAESLRFGNSRLQLSGIDYRAHGPHIDNADELISPGDFNLLLAHTPEAFPEAAAKGFDAVLSGHTHGGQINLDVVGTNFNIVDLKTPYTKGLYRRDNSLVYVNSGLGTIGVPVRLGAPPEITLIRLCSS